MAIYSTKFFHNFHLSESSFTCVQGRASTKTVYIYIQLNSTVPHTFVTPLKFKKFSELKVFPRKKVHKNEQNGI